ncbi:MAG: hypothetical protein KIT45_03990 [Fimbriimonadia bacterium]|nr:hypothetical protein [Fimbriimonadia bacterium]
MTKESFWLILICLADAVSTFFFIERGMATEANPFMNWVLGYGWGPFFIVKGATVGIAVGYAEWMRRRDPNFARKWMRLAVTLYLLVWTLGVLSLNATG